MDDPLAAAKAKLKPLITKGQFAVFVFGPALRAPRADIEPRRRASSHLRVARHAQYLRYRTKEALREIGFAADYGEASDVLKFWRNFFRSPNVAASEILQARLVCGAIVIFPASFGSIAELALFAQRGNIAEKTLAIVHEGYDGASSFFRRGLLELFSIFSGRNEFLDDRDHDACVTQAVRFVEGQYYRTMDELSDQQRLAARHRGTVFEHALERSPN